MVTQSEALRPNRVQVSPEVGQEAAPVGLEQDTCSAEGAQPHGLGCVPGLSIIYKHELEIELSTERKCFGFACVKALPIAEGSSASRPGSDNCHPTLGNRRLYVRSVREAPRSLHSFSVHCRRDENGDEELL